MTSNEENRASGPIAEMTTERYLVKDHTSQELQCASFGTEIIVYGEMEIKADSLPEKPEVKT